MRRNDELILAEEQRARQQKEEKKNNIYNAFKIANNQRQQLGQLGKTLSTNSNSTISNLGNNMYKYSGEGISDSLKNGIQSKLSSLGTNPNVSTLTQPAASTATTAGATGAEAGLTGATTAGATGATTAGTTGAGLSGLAGGTAGTAGTTAGLTGATTAGATGAGALGAGAAGAGTAGAGAGAAGAGALGAAGAGAAAIPVVGWAAAAAALAYGLYKSHKAKKDAKAFQKDAEGIQELEQNEENQWNENAQQENNMQKYADMVNQQLGLGGEVGKLPTNNTSSAELNPEGSIDTNEYSSAPLTEAIMNEVQGNANPQGDSQSAITNAIIGELQGSPSTEQSSPTRSFVEQQAPAQEVQSPAIAESSQAPQGSQDSKAGLIENIMKGYQENVTHSAGDKKQLMPESERNWQTRLGEGLGTMSRMAQNPALQGLIAGGINYAINKDAGKAIDMGMKYATDKSQTNYYRNELAKKGIYTNPGILGQISSTDYRTQLQQPMQDAMTDKYRQDALDKQMKNEATQLMNNMTPETFSLAASMATSPRKAAELLTQYEQQNGVLDDSQRKILNEIMGNPDLIKIFSDANKNTNAFVKNNTDKEKFEWTKGRVENNLPTQISRMDVVRTGGVGGYSGGSRSSGGGSSYKPENPTNNPENYVKVLNDDGTVDYVTRKNVTPKDLEKIKKKNKAVKQKIQNERNWQSPANPLDIKGL